MKKISRYLSLLVVSCIFTPFQTSFAQVCTPVFNDGLGVGNALGFPLQDYLNVRHFITCPPAVPPNGLVQEPALRLDYDDESYFGQLSMVRNVQRNSLLSVKQDPEDPPLGAAPEGDLVLRNSCTGDDIILTTQSTTGAIRFATTATLLQGCPAEIPPNNEPAQPATLNDKERMTILPNGNVGIGTMNSSFSATTTQAVPIKSPFQVGNISVQPVNFSAAPVGTWGSVAFNSFWDPSIGKPRRLENGPVSGIGFEPWHDFPLNPVNDGTSHGINADGGISLFVSENGTANSIYDNGCGMVLRPDVLFVNMWQPDQNIPDPGLDPDVYRVLFEYKFPTWNSGKTEIQDNGRLFIRDKVRIGKEDLNPFATRPFGGEYKLAVFGSILAQELVIDMRPFIWSDFVFDASYKLTPILELEKYVNEQHHLPDIPNAQEVKDNGLPIGEFQAKLLEKVEELTLYIIELKKENVELKKRIEVIEIK